MIKLSFQNSSNTTVDTSDHTSTQRSVWNGSTHSKSSTGSSTVRTRSFPLTYSSLHDLLSPKSTQSLRYVTMDSDSSDEDHDDDYSGKLEALRSIPDLSDSKVSLLSKCHGKQTLDGSSNTLATEDTTNSDVDGYDGFTPSYHCYFSPILRKNRIATADSSSPSATTPQCLASLPGLMINTRDKSRGTIWVHSPDCEIPHLELSVPLLCGPRKATVAASSPETSPVPPKLSISSRRRSSVDPTERSPSPSPGAAASAEQPADPPGSQLFNCSPREIPPTPSPRPPGRRKTRRSSLHSRRASPRRRRSTGQHACPPGAPPLGSI